jgi:hypothetical protein
MKRWRRSFLIGSSSHLVGTLPAFGTYTVGFFAWPLGGIIGGHFGDRAGP